MPPRRRQPDPDAAYVYKRLPMVQESSCSCTDCQHMCRIPCVPTPHEAQRLIDAGYGSKLMLTYSRHDDPRWCTLMLAPANPGYEGNWCAGVPPERFAASLFDYYDDSPLACFVPPPHASGCVMQRNGLCTLHRRKLKPLEGRLASCAPHVSNADGEALNHAIAATWRSPRAKALIASWRKTYGKKTLAPAPAPRSRARPAHPPFKLPPLAIKPPKNRAK